MIARKTSTCNSCGGTISPGQSMVWNRYARSGRHSNCAPKGRKRDGRLSGAAFVREMRRLDHQADGLAFQKAFADTDEKKAQLTAALERIDAKRTEVYNDYKGITA